MCINIKRRLKRNCTRRVKKKQKNKERERRTQSGEWAKWKKNMSECATKCYLFFSATVKWIQKRDCAILNIICANTIYFVCLHLNGCNRCDFYSPSTHSTPEKSTSPSKSWTPERKTRNQKPTEAPKCSVNVCIHLWVSERTNWQLIHLVVHSLFFLPSFGRLYVVFFLLVILFSFCFHDQTNTDGKTYFSVNGKKRVQIYEKSL